MSRPASREEFKEYCLRKLGHPVITINVDPLQVEDRIDDALSKYWEYHFDGREEDYLVIHMTPTDVANNYITLDDKVFAVSQILPYRTSAASSVSLLHGAFTAEYQFYLNDVYNSSGMVFSGNLQYIDAIKSYIATMNRLLVPPITFRFNRKTNKLYLDGGIKKFYDINPVIVAKVYKKLDETQNPDIWDDEWLKDYATALIKKQWGSNLKKFGSVTLPGGITLNGEAIYNEAVEEIQKLEEKLIIDLCGPLDYVIA